MALCTESTQPLTHTLKKKQDWKGFQSHRMLNDKSYKMTVSSKFYISPGQDIKFVARCNRTTKTFRLSRLPGAHSLKNVWTKSNREWYLIFTVVEVMMVIQDQGPSEPGLGARGQTLPPDLADNQTLFK